MFSLVQNLLCLIKLINFYGRQRQPFQIGVPYLNTPIKKAWISQVLSTCSSHCHWKQCGWEEFAAMKTFKLGVHLHFGNVSLNFLSCEHILTMKVSVWHVSLTVFTFLLCALLPDWQHHVIHTQKNITNFLGPVTHPPIVKPVALVLCPSPHTILLLYSVLFDQRCFSPMPPSKWVYPQILSAWAMLEEDLELGCNAFSLR